MFKQLKLTHMENIKSVPLYERGHKIYLNPEQTKESEVNRFFACRDGIITMTEYYDECGYGSLTRLYLCRDTKHESVCIIRQTKLTKDTWTEETMFFDSDSFANFLHLLGNKENPYEAEIKLLRDY